MRGLDAAVAAAIAVASAGCSNGSLSTGSRGSVDAGDSGAGGSAREGFVIGTTGALQEGNDQVFDSSFTAGFNDAAEVPLGTSCVARRILGCIANTCEVSVGTDAGVASRVHAGIISIQGTKRPVALAPLSNGSYPLIQDKTQTFWSGGETVTFTALGDRVPAFVDTLTAPSQPTITSPALPAGQPLVIPQQLALSVSWSGATSGTIAVTLTRQQTPLKYATVTCELDAANGSGQLPAAALQEISSGSTGGTYAFTARSAKNVRAGTVDVRLQLDAIGRTPGGARAAGAATFQ
jgi:hypothetical protein